MFLLLLFLTLITGKEIILSSGLNNWTHAQLQDQYNAFKTYTNLNMITTASILTYYLTDDGKLTTYQTNDTQTAENYQVSLKNLGLKALPCLFCDATIGMCSNLNNILENLYANEDNFINETVYRANYYGWSGYSVDFEPDSIIDKIKLTKFLIKWNSALTKNKKFLSVWIGADTQYDDELLLNSTINLITMNTYNTDYHSFIDVAAKLQILVNDNDRLGFGLLTNYKNKVNKGKTTKWLTKNETDNINKITKWLTISKIETLSLWASHIPPEWYEPLINFNSD